MTTFSNRILGSNEKRHGNLKKWLIPGLRDIKSKGSLKYVVVSESKKMLKEQSDGVTWGGPTVSEQKRSGGFPCCRARV